MPIDTCENTKYHANTPIPNIIHATINSLKLTRPVNAPTNINEATLLTINNSPMTNNTIIPNTTKNVILSPVLETKFESLSFQRYTCL